MAPSSPIPPFEPDTPPGTDPPGVPPNPIPPFRLPPQDQPEEPAAPVPPPPPPTFPNPPPGPAGTPIGALVGVAPELPKPYVFSNADFALLLIRSHYPERTDKESHVIRAFLLAHIREFDRIEFAKRVGRGADIDPTTLPAIQRATLHSSRLKIDILAWRATQPIIIEVKVSVTPAALGQILTYQHHFREEYPDAGEPELVVVGAESSPDAVAALNAHGVAVYLYPEALTGSDASGGRV